jgi:hypothetical protein
VSSRLSLAWFRGTVSVAAALLLMLVVPTPAAASVGAVSAQSLTVAAGEKDADADTIPDVVEREVCGTATCAVGIEDRDRMAFRIGPKFSPVTRRRARR